MIPHRLEISLYPAENGIVCLVDDYSSKPRNDPRYCAKDLDDALAWIAKTARAMQKRKGGKK